MATKAISKMNKKELYTLCQEQKAEIQNTHRCRDTAAARRVTRGGEKTNEIAMLHNVINEYKKDNEKLKGETDRAEHYKRCYEKEVKEQAADRKRFLEELFKKEELKEEVKKLKEEKFNYNVFLEEKHNMIIMINELKEEVEELKKELKYQRCEYHTRGHKLKEVLEENEKLKETNIKDFEYGEDDDDWQDGAGFKYFKKEKEYVIYMCGGCAEWWNYVLTPQGIYKEDTHGREKQDQDLWCCPGGTYLSLQDKDYEPREGESLIWEMCDESFFNEEHSDDECDVNARRFDDSEDE
tara:strand:- start:19 stop:906 length:888 start_codon:yes stop_codon:yes gene_type:complete